MGKARRKKEKGASERCWATEKEKFFSKEKKISTNALACSHFFSVRLWLPRASVALAPRSLRISSLHSLATPRSHIDNAHLLRASGKRELACRKGFLNPRAPRASRLHLLAGPRGQSINQSQPSAFFSPWLLSARCSRPASHGCT